MIREIILLLGYQTNTKDSKAPIFLRITAFWDVTASGLTNSVTVLRRTATLISRIDDGGKSFFQKLFRLPNIGGVS